MAYAHEIAAQMLGEDSPSDLPLSLRDMISDVRSYCSRANLGDLQSAETIALTCYVWSQIHGEDTKEWRTNYSAAKEKVDELDLDIDQRRSHQDLIETIEEYQLENE